MQQPLMNSVNTTLSQKYGDYLNDLVASQKHTLNCHASLRFVIFGAAYETEGIFSLFWAKVGLKRTWQWVLCLFND